MYACTNIYIYPISIEFLSACFVCVCVFLVLCERLLKKVDLSSLHLNKLSFFAWTTMTRWSLSHKEKQNEIRNTIFGIILFSYFFRNVQNNGHHEKGHASSERNMHIMWPLNFCIKCRGHSELKGNNEPPYWTIYQSFVRKSALTRIPCSQAFLGCMDLRAP